MKRLNLMLCILVIASVQIFGQQPTSHPTALWELDSEYSDEFSGTLDQSKWNNNVGDWGTWSWEPENAWVEDTTLVLQMQQKTHTRGGSEYYFNSGIIQNYKTITYGYFEARIKASAKGQGTCPAFWLYSVGQPTPTEEGGVKYSEIDVVEIFQIPNDIKRLEMNLHTRIIEDGVLTWKRPGQGDTELCHNTWLAPWDPRDEYHTYGVLNRVDSIFWYVDGVQRGSKKNYYWHLPMHMTVSMGLRTPYEKYIDGVRTIMPYPDDVPEPGFPTQMYCDYVRMWNTPAYLIADKQKYQESEFHVDSILSFECYWDAGNGYEVLVDEYGGISCTLKEVMINGAIVNEIILVDATGVGNQAGKSTFDFTLADLIPTADLPAGHSYVLVPAFKTSNENTTITIENGIRNITIVDDISIGIPMDQTDKEYIEVYPNPASDKINVRVNNLSDTETLVFIYDITGSLISSRMLRNDTNEQIDVSRLSKGLYIIKTEFCSSNLFIIK